MKIEFYTLLTEKLIYDLINHCFKIEVTLTLTD